MKLTDAVIKI